MEPATAVDAGQRSGTSWNSAPLPAPSAAKHSMNSSVVAVRLWSRLPHTTSVTITTASTPVSVLMPPQRSEIQPPKMRSAAPMKAASIVN